MQSQNEEKSEEEITIIPDEKIAYGRKRKVVENDAEVIDKAEFEKHVQSQKRKKSAKLSSRIQPTRKMKTKEEEDDDDDDNDDQHDINDEMDEPKLEEKDDKRNGMNDDSKKVLNYMLMS
ncbi:nucleophosmin-like [Chenopodium quinoa]|uniref:nucleophosmin-like n=1 Tax=Chenopodium quinoa TaxID=63459 RepID=UPI000B786E3E|nr:nucleophosmin-like [Chenopodium quinoa]